MSITIQNSPAYISASETFKDLLFPPSYTTKKPASLEQRIQAIPSKSQALVVRNSRQGLERLLKEELAHYETLQKIESSEVSKMASFLVTTEDSIRKKKVIIGTTLSEQVTEINKLMGIMKANLNNVAYELEKMDKTSGILSGWFPDPNFTYFTSAKDKYLKPITENSPPTLSVVKKPAVALQKVQELEELPVLTSTSSLSVGVNVPEAVAEETIFINNLPKEPLTDLPVTPLTTPKKDSMKLSKERNEVPAANQERAVATLSSNGPTEAPKVVKEEINPQPTPPPTPKATKKEALEPFKPLKDKLQETTIVEALPPNTAAKVPEGEKKNPGPIHRKVGTAAKIGAS